LSHANGGNNMESRKGKTVATLSNSAIKEKVHSFIKKTRACVSHSSTSDFRQVWP
jgi:hypothetical protein